MSIVGYRNRCGLAVALSVFLCGAANAEKMTWVPNVFSEMKTAKGAEVARLVPDPPSTGATAARGWHALESAPADSAWTVRFVDLLSMSRAVGVDRCAILPSEEEDDDRLVVRVRLDARKAPITADLDFGQRCADLRRGGRRLGCVEIEASAESFLKLLSRALPRDSVLARALEAARPPRAQVTAEPTAAPERISASGDQGDPKFGEYVRVDELPEPIKKVSPHYPEGARNAVDGLVMVQALVGKDGRVKETRIVKSIPELDESAMQCVRQWIFKPAQTAGAPVAVWIAIPIRFALR